MKAIINTAVCQLLAKPTRESSVEDEALYGMVVDILEECAPGWYKVRTHYRYEGIVDGNCLILDPEAVAAWEASPKLVVRNKNHCDVLSRPKVQGWHLAQLCRGCLVTPVGDAADGYQLVRLVDGREGYVMAGILDTYYEAPSSDEEQTLRQQLVDAAMLYQGTHYRWGGKSPNGIDCSGLCSMAYTLCGILIYRDAKIVEGFPMHEISLENIQPGDLLFWPGHVGMYIGGDRYCHSTAKAGSDGFTINSLNPEHPDFRSDLKERITAVASYF